MTGAVGPISATTQLTAVIGNPIRHSLSPAIHNAAFALHGLDWRMVAFETDETSGLGAVAAMKTFGIRGLAVTTPLKTAVAAAVDEIDGPAAALDSVNTVVLREDGSTLGASTDGAGFVDSLVAAGCGPTGRRVVVVGAGAAGRSIVDALGRAEAESITIVNRSDAAAQAAARLAPMANVGTVEVIADADIVVNATPIGMASTERANLSPIDADLIRPGMVVADIVYHPLETPLLAAARARGAVTVDGLGMLIEQARRQQQLWTELCPDADPLREAALCALAARVG